MMNANREAPERQDIEALLPWHAAGTLNRRDAERVAQALSNDRELARRFELVREELGETIHLNESLGAPSARSMEKLFAAIDAEAPVARKKASLSVMSRVVEFVASFSPRTVAYAASAAALALVIQAAVLTSVVVRDQGAGSPQLASYDNGTQLAVVRFTSNATLTDVTNFLNVNNAAVVHGPRMGGLYDIRLNRSPMSEAEFARLIQRLKAESRIVEFIAVKN